MFFFFRSTQCANDDIKILNYYSLSDTTDVEDTTLATENFEKSVSNLQPEDKSPKLPLENKRKEPLRIKIIPQSLQATPISSESTVTNTMKPGSLNVRSCEQINLLVEYVNKAEGTVRVKPLSKLCKKVQTMDDIQQASSIQLTIDQIKTEPESPPAMEEDCDEYNQSLEDFLSSELIQDECDDDVIIECPEVEITTSNYFTQTDSHVDHNYHSLN